MIRCELEEHVPCVSPAKQSPQAQHMARSMIASSVSNPQVIDDVRYQPPCVIDTRLGPFDASDTPAPDDAPIDVLIITDNVMYDAYQEYARMTRLHGYATTVRTLSWIRQHYSGVDDAERIRAFIRSAVNEWGVLYVILGGDTQVIPARWVYMEPLYDRWPVHIVSDLYYADLDGNWNHDGDDKFGEVDDSLDLAPDVFVGRLPTITPHEVLQYRDKYMGYMNSPPCSSNIHALFITSDFEVTNDAYNMAKRLAQHLPAYFDTVFLNECPLQEVIDSLDHGFGFVAGLGHGDNNNLRIRNNPRENIYNYVFDALGNGSTMGIMGVITCYTNTIQTDCLGEHWILNPHGGGIVYIGPTCCSEAYLHEEFTNALLDSLYHMPVGAAHTLSKIPFLSQAQWDNWYRLYEFCIVMLGDPTIRLWHTVPATWSIVNTSTDTLACGRDSLSLYCSPMVSYQATFVKDHEMFVRDSASNGILNTELITKTPGRIEYMIRTDDIVPHYGTLYVHPGKPRLFIESFRFTDSLGNNNGVVNPGDTLCVQVVLKNSGSDIATDVNGTIACDDPHVSILVDSSSFGDIAGDETGINNSLFLLSLDGGVQNGHVFDLSFAVHYKSTTGDSSLHDVDSLHGVCSAPVIEHYSQTLHAGVQKDTLWYSIVTELRNKGHAMAEDITARIHVSNDSITVIDSLIAFPPIPANTVISSGNDAVTVCIPDSSTTVAYDYTLYMDSVLISTIPVVIDTPGIPDQVQVIPYDNVIQITWQSVQGASGYRVLRSPEPDSGYVVLTDEVVPVCFYHDYAVSQGARYYYRIQAVDQWMNHGVPSVYSVGSLAPSHAAGWPRPVYDYLFSSCAVGDIDPFYPGYEIIVCGKDGRVYAWHCDGSPVGEHEVLYDLSPTQVWTSPAIGDVNHDNANEIVFGVRRSTDNLYVINAYGQCPAGWPITVPGQIIGSPVLADLDQNGTLEIIIWTVQADIYIFEHTGTGYNTPNGLLKELPGIAFGSVSVGDIDRDGDLEIVCAGGSNGDSLFVWDHECQPVAPFPIFIQSGGLTYSTVLGDICGDSRLEILFYADNSEGVYAVSADGTVLWFTLLGNVADIEGSPVIGDVTGNGYPEVICGYQTGFTILDSLGHALPNFPDSTHDAKLAVIGDMDQNGQGDAVVGSVDWMVYAYGAENQQVPGFPMIFNNRIESSPAVFDIDRDGQLELLVGGNGLFFHVFDLRATQCDWPLFRYDQYNSGTYQSGNLMEIASTGGRREVNDHCVTVFPTVFLKDLHIRLPHALLCETTDGHCITIYDVCGRSVWSCDVPRYASAAEVVWDGRDNAHRMVAAGVYFVICSSGDRTYTTKVIKVE
jgi:hypothetical protein